jgi:hypothetical protein
MRSVPALVAAVALGAVVLASGCGQQHAGAPAGPPPSGSASAPMPSPAPGDPGTASCHSASTSRAASTTITYADNGQTVCVRRGTAVQVYLKGTPPNLWSAIHATGDALTPHANGRLMLALGVTGASFLAAHPGIATIRSFQQPCGPNTTPGNGAAQSGVLECGVIIAFHITVKVT